MEKIILKTTVKHDYFFLDLEVEAFNLGAFELVDFAGAVGVSAGTVATSVAIGAIRIGLVVGIEVVACK